MKRRIAVAGAAAGLAAAAGMGWRLWSERAEPAGIDTDGFWSLSFPTPAGPPLAMASFRNQPLLLNFWATWCPPCVQEMPELDRFARSHAAAGWRVLGLAVDNAAAVRDFLQRTPVNYAVALAGFDGLAWVRRLGNAEAGLPYTLAFDRQGRVVRTHAGATTADALAAWAREMA